MREQQFELYIRCQLDREYFADWEEMSPEVRAFWEKKETAPTRCDGGGNMGSWCQRCTYCSLYEIDEE